MILHPAIEWSNGADEMIVGVGSDILEIDRMRRHFERTPGLKERIFAPDEIAYCQSKVHYYQYFAGRFAAKEAAMKALGTGWRGGLRFQDFVIFHDDLGKPLLRIEEPSRSLIPNIDTLRFHVTITHDAGIAFACVIVEHKV